MEDIKILSDVIGALLEQGYSLDFEALEQIRCNQDSCSIATLKANEFVIDEVYRCSEYERSSEIIYVFAISSQKYMIKGITISTTASESSITVGEILHKIKEAFISLFKIRS